jgi:putative oxidoreductase
MKWYHDIGLLLLRVFAGLGMAWHGYEKLAVSGRLSQFIEGVGEMGFPFPVFFAWAAILAELVGGILLAAGLFTRPAAAFILITMLVAAFVRHADDPFAIKEKALLYASIALALLFTGAGRWAVDRMLRKS